MDRDVVRSALSEVHNIDGNEYLEKIIQVPFELPELRKSKLHNILFNKLDEIINDLPNEMVLDENYWGHVFRYCISPYINTLRDVNRLINTFQFRYGMLHHETSFEDMLGISTLEALEPELYKWISNNKDAVCGGPMHGFLSNSGNKPDYRKLYHDEFASLGIDPKMAISCVSTLFPVFAKDVNENQYIYHPKMDFKGMMRVADQGRFESYFMLDFEDIKVSRGIINACIYEHDRDTIKRVIEELNKQGNIVFFLEEVKSLVDKIPYKRLSLIASVILGLQGEFKGENSGRFFTISASDTAEYLTYDIIKKFNTEEEKYEIIRSAVENVKKNGLGIMARIINRIELAYGRLAGESEKEDQQFISLVHLEELEKFYLERIRTIASSESILDINDFRFAFYLWECFDKCGLKDYLDGLFEDEVNKLKFICAIAGRWYGDRDNGWSFDSKNYSEYLSQDEIYNIIQAFGRNNLHEFTEIEQIKLASFALNYHKNEMGHVNEQEARKLINQWKTGKME